MPRKVIINANTQNVTISSNMIEKDLIVEMSAVSGKNIYFLDNSKSMIDPNCSVHLDNGMIIVEKGAEINDITYAVRFYISGPWDGIFSETIMGSQEPLAHPNYKEYIEIS
ncbi:MAG: hypothetical protein KA998_00375 [Rickettsiaceae bacterium]|nr:hypothetical protein [Rickettsiaceae bacterium]